MQTLAPPTPVLPELNLPLCEQVVPGSAAPEEELEEEGKIGTGGAAPEPLQGGADAGDREVEQRTGNEGAGT